MTGAPAIDQSARRFVLLGLLVLTVLVAGLGGWAVQTPLASAVVVSGSIRPDGTPHAVQHATGGVLQEVLVRDGDVVEPGQLLARLDTSRARTTLDLARDQWLDLSAQFARLGAEIRGDGALTFDPDLQAAIGQAPDRSGILSGQRALFDAHRATERAEEVLFRQQGRQLAAQILGHEGHLAAKNRQLTLTAAELEAQNALLTRGLVPATTVRQLERDVAQLEGELAQLAAQRSAAQLQHDSLREDYHTRQLQRRQDRISEARALQEPLRKWRREVEVLRREIEQSDIRAPLGGIVHRLHAQTPQAVLRPAEPLLFLVPAGETLLAQGQVQPRHREDLRVGQPAKLRLTAHGSAQAPQLTGQVTRISADAIQQQAASPPYFSVWVEIDADALATLPPGSTLLPGMPVEIYLQTGEATALHYLTRPFTDYVARALRES